MKTKEQIEKRIEEILASLTKIEFEQNTMDIINTQLNTLYWVLYEDAEVE